MRNCLPNKKYFIELPELICLQGNSDTECLDTFSRLSAPFQLLAYCNLTVPIFLLVTKELVPKWP